METALKRSGLLLFGHCKLSTYDIQTDCIPICETSTKKLLCKGILHIVHQRPPDWTSTEIKREPVIADHLGNGRSPLESETLLGKTIFQLLHLKFDDLLDCTSIKSVEYYDLINSVDEFRLERMTDDIDNLLLGNIKIDISKNLSRSKVACHYDYSVTEINHSALTVSQSAIVKKLKKNI